jgi:hypothetical protein
MVNKSSLIVLELKIPNEVWSSSPADYSKLRVFSDLLILMLRKVNLG